MYDSVMKRIVVLVSSLSVLGLACARPPVAPAVTLAKPEVVRTSNALPVERLEQDLSLRKSGDYVVYRFSGSYRDSPVTMTQQVVAVRDGKSVLDLTIDDGGAHVRLRMRLDGDGNLLSVAELEGTVQRPFGVQAYEQMMNEIMLSADDNSGLMSSDETIVDVAGVPLAVTSTEYRVRVGAHDAIMKTMAADDFAWGDIGGEIRTLDGKLLYKAEIIELGSERSTIAVHGEEDLYEGYDFLDDI